jgi:copper oxidase (laccase) domain-containing protein
LHRPFDLQEHYQVGEEVVAAADRIFDRSEGLSKRKTPITMQTYNVPIINLERSGVRQVEQSHICTASDTQDWFSHRAENGKTGRFGAVISLKEQ